MRTDPLEIIQPQSLKHLSEHLQSLVRGRLWLKVLIGMVLGVGVGVLIGPSTGWVDPERSLTVSSWLALPGQVFLAAIQMIAVPLVFASIIRGLAASENLDQLRRMGIYSVTFFILTTTVAIVLGIGLALVIEPGRRLAQAPEVATAATEVDIDAADAADPLVLDGTTLPEALVSLIPRNPLDSMVHSEMLGVVLFALIVGVALVSLPAKDAEPMLNLLGSLQQVSMTIVKWTMRLAPWAVFGLMVQLSAKLGLAALVGMAVYVGTVLLGLLLLLGLYLVIVWIGARRNPVAFMRDVREVQLLAFSTSSSAAVMPLSIKTAEDRLGLRASISQFVIPLGATINMNGTALYQGVATIFLAQVYGLELTTVQLALVIVTAVAASIGSPATPGVGIVILSMVLDSVGVPVAGIGLIFGVDRVLDMSRTAVNVTGDLVAAAVMDRHLSHGILTAAGTPARAEAPQRG